MWSQGSQPVRPLSCVGLSACRSVRWSHPSMGTYEGSFSKGLFEGDGQQPPPIWFPPDWFSPTCASTLSFRRSRARPVYLKHVDLRGRSSF